MSVEKTVTVSWFSRLKQSIGGVLFGLCLIAAMVVMLFWNEGRAVRVTKALAEGTGNVVAVAAGSIDPANEARLVHVSGQANATAPLLDAGFGVSAPALQLRRKVEMFQWVEHSTTERKVEAGGRETQVTRYAYEKEWSSQWQDASRFQEPDGHANPVMAFEAATFTATDARLGAWQLDAQLLARIGVWQAWVPGAEQAAAIARALPGRRVGIVEDAIFIGATPEQPQVGDYRVRHDVTPMGPISVVARQQGNALGVYPARSGEPLLIVQPGIVEAAAMFEAAERSNAMQGWIFRALGIACLMFGFSMLLRPLSVAGSVWPLLGRVLAAGTGMVAAVLGIATGAITMAVAWLFHRPLLAMALVAVALLSMAGLLWLLRRRRAKPQPEGA